MNTTAIKTFGKLLLQQTRNYKKESLIGLLFLAISTGAYLTNQAVGNLLVITYLFVSSTANFTKNEIFWNANDFKSLNVTILSKQYFVFYLIQRILLDSFVTNLIVVLGLTVFLFIKFGILQVTAFILLVVLYFAISPYCSIIYSKNNKVTTATCVTLLVLIPTVLWLDFAFWKQVRSLYFIYSIVDCIYCFIFATVIFFLFAIVSITCKSQKNSTYPSRVIFRPLKKIDIWLYKDYMLNYKMVFTNIISLIITLLLFANSDDIGILRPFLLWLICGIKIFSVKEKSTKELLLVFNDPLFCKKTVAQDCLMVRKKKFKTVLTGSLIKFGATLPFLIVLGFTSIEDILIFGITSFISAKFECFTIFKSGLSTQAVIYSIKTTIPIVWGCIILNNYSLVFFYIYMAIMLFISTLLLYGITNKKSVDHNSSVI